MTTNEPFPRADAITLLNAIAYSETPDDLVADEGEILTIHYKDGTSRHHQFSFEEAQEVKRHLPAR